MKRKKNCDDWTSVGETRYMYEWHGHVMRPIDYGEHEYGL